jgi:23S rRNA (uracil1939-C5)-methyltransferase
VTDLIELDIERPVAGGRMLARIDGRVVFVAGAIPGERVQARVERANKQGMWARATEILSASPDRREPAGDPACGIAYAYIAYPRQLQLKGELIADAFRRIARLPLDTPPAVLASEETGYRLRARLHLRGTRLGFFREGTHELCDAAPTGQLHADTVAAAQRVASALGPRRAECESLTVAENVAATERVFHLAPQPAAHLDDLARRLDLPDGATGLTTAAGDRLVTLAGSAAVTDAASALFRGHSPVGDLVAWTRKATSFFQGNRFLTGTLVSRVLAAVAAGHIVDLYAGVGLFSVAFAARGSTVLAVEGDRSAAGDLEANAGPFRDRLRVVRAPIERVVTTPPDPLPDAVIVDPPRTGISAEAVRGLISWRAPRIVYVSCDPPTLARDAARLVEAGYRIESLEALDLFPNTPHVETIAVFTFAPALRTPSAPAPA